MIYAEKGNKVIRINESDEDRYLGMGFDIRIDGEVIKRSTPSTISACQAEITRLTKENEQLHETVNALEAKIAELTKPAEPTPRKKKTVEKVEDKVEE